MTGRKRRLAHLAVAVFLIAITAWIFRNEMRPSARPAKRPRAGSPVPDFLLVDENGVAHRLKGPHKTEAAVFFAHSSESRHLPLLAAHIREWKTAFPGVRFFWIDPNPGETRASLQKSAREISTGIPLLSDPSQVVTKALGLRRAGDAAVVGADGFLLYRGPATDDFAGTLTAVLRGQTQTPGTRTPSRGEPLRFRFTKRITYSDSIAPLVTRKCLMCHDSHSELPLNSYESLKEHAAEIRQSLYLNRMPPFTADPAYGPYLNDISLQHEEKRRLLAWIEAGTPYAGGDDPLQNYEKKPVRKAALERIRDKRIYHAENQTPIPITAEGNKEYGYVQLGGPIPRDMWVSAIHVRPKTAQTLLLASLYVVPDPLKHFMKVAAGQDERHKCFESDLYVIGALSKVFKPERSYAFRGGVWSENRLQPFVVPHSSQETAIFLPKGYQLILETYYEGTGQARTDSISVDFFGTTESAHKRPLRTYTLKTEDILIPAAKVRHEEETAHQTMDHPIALTSLSVHMHMRGRAARLIEHKQDGSVRTLLSFPSFVPGFAGSMNVTLKNPVRIPAGSTISGVCEYDNSSAAPSPMNPDGSVRFGMTKDGSEMCNLSLTYFDVN